MAAAFDGSNQNFVTTPGIVTGPPFAWSMWLWRNVTENMVFFNLTDTSAPTERWTGFLTGSAVRHYAIVSGVNAFATISGTPLNGWFHAFGREVTTSLRDVWLNGSTTGTNTETSAVSTPITSNIGGISAGSLPMKGKIAEVAFWDGAGAENMGLEEAAILAQGYSPLCLTNYLPNLAFYQPLVRDENWNSIGLDLTPENSPDVTDHPRIIYPGAGLDNAIRAPGAGSAGRVQSQGILPLGLNFER